MTARDNTRKAIKWLVDTRFGGSQTRFAEDIGVTRQKANNWMTGFCSPDLDMVGYIARKNKLSLDWVIGGDTSKAPSDFDGYTE